MTNGRVARGFDSREFRVRQVAQPLKQNFGCPVLRILKGGISSYVSANVPRLSKSPALEERQGRGIPSSKAKPKANFLELYREVKVTQSHGMRQAGPPAQLIWEARAVTD
jgi:hypothetical protein